MTKNLTLFIFLIGSALSFFAKNSFQLQEINLQNIDNPAAKFNLSGFRFKETDYIVIQPKNNSVAYLQENGIKVSSYLGDGYYMVEINANDTKSILQNLSVLKTGYIVVDSKVDDNIKSDNNSIPVTVLYSASVDANDLSAMSEKIGISITNNNLTNHHFRTYATPDQRNQLAQYPFVYYITKFYPNKNPLITEGSLMLSVNQVWESQPYGYNLKGENINVGIWDDGAVGENFDLPPNRNIVIDGQNNSLSYMTHPTEVAGCIGGGGNIFPTFKGIAPKCNLYYWDVYNDIVNEVKDGKLKYNVDISNHSYNFAATTCSESGPYLPEAADLDKLVNENPTLLPVLAVGNSASANCAVATDTFSSIDIGFQGSKNVITVGWLFSNQKIVENSGRGPTSDGRLKPELVAKGFGVQTNAPNNGFTAVYGSSFAAPQIAGLAALMYQKYKQQFGILPNSSLIKAILCNTATDLGKPGPDYIYGFGIPHARKAIYTIDNNLFFEDNVTQNILKTHSIAVPANQLQLSITLSWTDKEGNPIASKSLVNDLDLKLVSPNGDTIFPWKLDPELPQNKALRGIDKLNNIEQITLNNPTSGAYRIVVAGTSIPFGPQYYSLAFFTQERKIELTNPNGGEILDPGSTVIRWYNNGIDSLAKIEFSPDNGANWQTVINNIQLSSNSYTWTLPNLVSNQCLIKITSGNNFAVSAAPFTIGTQINYPQINYTVCDKTIKINWPAVTGATAYKIYLYTDSVWINVGQTNLTTFTINNLINGKKYLYSISTIKNDAEGNRSFFTIFTPLANACLTSNDVGVYALYKPIGGRKFTSSALTSTEKLSFIIKNFGTTAQNSISVSYKLNGGTTQTTSITDLVTSNDTSIVRFSINEDLSVIGSYSVVAWTNLDGDNNRENDTLRYIIRHLPNTPLTLPFTESFENTNEVLTNTTFGINGLNYADYYNEQGGRYRSNEGNLFANTGLRAFTLDNYLGVSPAKQNELIFTLNLANYWNSLIYLDLSYMNRSESDSNDAIYARGDDTKPWVKVYDLYTNRGTVGKYKKVKEIVLSRIGQYYSSSSQLKIVQTGIKAATSPYGDGGYTFDDLKLYSGGRDVAMTNASVKKVFCSHKITAQPISVVIKNNTNQNLTNVPVNYKINNDTIVSEIIPLISSGDTLTYSFTTLFNKTNPGVYNLKIWMSNPGDNYKLNDSFNTANVIILKTVDSFPYYNDFETNNGNLLSEGTNNSWIWGTPSKFNINDAAQENKAWTTGLNRGYNFNEDSYLYLGCLDFSSLTADPMIAFNFISVMQTQSDSAYAEYSTDGANWNRLGCYNCGLNWYNGYNSKPYWDQIIFPWQTAHITVPLNTLTDKSNFMCRIRLKSDEYAIAEGLGIDDIHILKDYQEMATADSAYVAQRSSANGWIQFFRNGKLIAELNDDDKNLGNIILGFEANMSKQKQLNNANILPRNWVIKPQNSIVGNYKLRLYLLNSEYTSYTINEDSINRMGDIGLLRYIGLNTNLDVSDNHVRSYYKYFSPQEIQFYPYQNGYYVEFNTDTLGEFYLISTRQDKNAIQNVNLLDFSAQKIDDDVYLNWKTTREVNSKEFVIQYSFDAATFIDIDTVPAGGSSNNTTLYNYLHQLNATIGIYYYRIKIVDNSNRFSFSLIDSVYFAPNVGVKQNTIGINAYIATNDIVVEFKNKLQMPSVVNVYNPLGQLQFTKKLQLVNGVNPLGITDFLHWSNTAYYLQIQTDEHNYYSKLMKR